MAHNDPETRKAYDKQYRALHAEHYRELQRARRNRMRDHARAFKDVPCSDCNGRFPYYVMDFDHRPGVEKCFEVADYLATVLVSNYDKLDAEIAKCDVVCANCHRIRTHNRRHAEIMPKDPNSSSGRQLTH
jgi:hypothetical protein